MMVASILVLVGLAFVLAEVFFPSLGLFGLIATGLIILADVLAFEESEPLGWSFIAAEIVLIPFVVYGGFRLLPRLPFGRRMILAGPTMKPGAGAPDLEYLRGKTGEALTDLRPVGTARFGDDRVPVIAVGGLIEVKTAIRVVAVEGSEIHVRPVPASTSDAAPTPDAVPSPDTPSKDSVLTDSASSPDP